MVGDDDGLEANHEDNLNNPPAHDSPGVVVAYVGGGGSVRVGVGVVGMGVGVGKAGVEEGGRGGRGRGRGRGRGIGVGTGGVRCAIAPPLFLSYTP